MTIPVLIFLAVTLGIIASYQLLAGILSPEKILLRRRLSEEFEEKSFASPSGLLLFKNLDHIRLDGGPVEMTDEEVAAIAARPHHKRSLRSSLKTALVQADVPYTLPQLGAAAAVLTVLCGAAGMLLGGPILGLAGVVLGAAAVPFYVHRKLQARRERMLQQLPEAFELMARVLRAGHSISQALQAVIDGVGKPVSEEFALCLHQQNMGLAPDLAFQEMVRRTPLLEMRIFAVALAIQRQTGGKLSEVLDRLAALIRARLRLRRHVQTLTAEGRLQGRVLFILPFALFAIMMVINRSYAELLLQHVPLLVATVAVMIVGVIWIRRIINIDV